MHELMSLLFSFFFDFLSLPTIHPTCLGTTVSLLLCFFHRSVKKSTHIRNTAVTSTTFEADPCMTGCYYRYLDNSCCAVGVGQTHSFQENLTLAKPFQGSFQPPRPSYLLSLRACVLLLQ